MLKWLSFSALLMCSSMLAQAAELKLGAGFALTSSALDLGDTSTTSSGGLAVEGSFLLDSGIENLKIGLNIGYFKYSHAEYPANSGLPGYGRDESNFPIFAVGKFVLPAHFFGELKVGGTLDRITTTTSEGNTTPYFAFGFEGGYSIPLTSAVSIEPSVDVYLYFVSGAYTQVTPKLSLAYQL